MRIIGIDPGIATTGVGVIETTGNTHKIIMVDTICTSPKDSLETRLFILGNTLESIIQKYTPFSMAIEELFFSRNTKTAIPVSQARGVLLFQGAKQGLSIYHYKPVEIKVAVCGYGRADKNQIQQMVKSLLKLPTIPKPDDAADALAIAICHAHRQKIDLCTQKAVR